jgi:2-polyprenyl-3-methyl-5-hydroxy-6-metoxy-1,4-benzoquinol methylase
MRSLISEHSHFLPPHLGGGSVIQHSAAEERAYWEQIYELSGADREKAVYAAHMDRFAYVAAHLRRLLEDLHDLSILSIGGGIDRTAIALAHQGNFVTSVDISVKAVTLTATLARQEGVAERMTFQPGDAEQIIFDNEFDVVLCKRCLHHMDFRRVLPRIVSWLKPGGRFIAEEPVCLTRLVDFFHRHLPFLTRPYIAGEVLFNPSDLEVFYRHFPDLHMELFEMLTRESIAYVFYRLGMERSLLPVGRLDYLLLNRWLPVLKPLGSSAILVASRGRDS